MHAPNLFCGITCASRLIEKLKYQLFHWTARNGTDVLKEYRGHNCHRRQSFINVHAHRVLSSDGMSIDVSVACYFRIVEPLLAIEYNGVLANA